MIEDQKTRDAIREIAGILDTLRQGGAISPDRVNMLMALTNYDRGNVYGYCPVCGGAGIARERRPNGDDRCEAGHRYFSSSAISSEEAAERRKRNS